MEWEEPREEKKKGVGLAEIGSILFIILTVAIVLCYLTIFVNPQIAFNPFKPSAFKLPTATPAAVAAVTQVPPTSTPPPSYPPTWTPTATPIPTRTNTPRPTATPTFTPGPVPQFSLYWDPIYTSQRLYGANTWWTGVAGEIATKAGKPVPDEIVKIWDDNGHVWQTKSGDASNYADKYGSALGGRGTYAWWEQFLGAGVPNVSCTQSFPVHVQVIRNGKGASPVVNVKTTGDCSKNLILIHFQKNW